MIKTLFKYSFAGIVLISAGLMALEYVILPLYVGYNKEHYLPDVRGKYLENARDELTKMGFSTEVIIKDYSPQYEPGTVISMAPRAFTKVKEGRLIKLTVAGERKEVELPDFTGESIRNAILELSRLNMEVDTVMEEFNYDFTEGTITYQSPRPGKLVKSGTKVTFMVSKGEPPDYFRVPDLLNLSLTKARILLQDAGLKAGEIEYEYHPDLIPETVIDQSLTPGMKLSIPARIDLVISTDKKEDHE